MKEAIERWSFAAANKASTRDPCRGPVEIVDIMTVQLAYRNKRGISALILKGRSFPTVTPAHISHQVFRLRKICDLNFAIFGHVGSCLDEAREEFVHTAEHLQVGYPIIDVCDFARLAVTQESYAHVTLIDLQTVDVHAAIEQVVIT